MMINIKSILNDSSNDKDRGHCLSMMTRLLLFLRGYLDWMRKDCLLLFDCWIKEFL